MNNIEIFGVPYLKKGSGIHIKKKNRGKFTEYCGGEVTDECILKARKSKNPKLRKRATFALNARGWSKKEQDGGTMFKNNFVNKRPVPGLLGPKSRKKTKIFGLVPKGAGGTFEGFWESPESFQENSEDEVRYYNNPGRITGFSQSLYDNILNARKYLIELGLSDVLIAALFGNIMKESSFNPNAVQQGGDNARGLFLMHGDRLKDYQKWYANQTLLSQFPEIDYFLNVINNKNDIYTNGYNKSKLNVLDAEKRLAEAKQNNSLVGLRTKEYNDALTYHNNIYGSREKNNSLYLVDDFHLAWNNPESTVEDLTHLFERTFERAGRPDTDKRIGYANLFYNHFNI